MPPSVNDHKRKQNGQFIRNKCKNKCIRVSSYIPKCKRLTHQEGVEKNITQPKGDSIQVENRSNNFKKRVVSPTFYVIRWKWQTYSACHQFLVVSKSYLDCIFPVPKEGCHSSFQPCCNNFVVKKVSKVFFFMLSFASSFRIFINVFTFRYVKANSKEIGKEILFPPFFRKMLMSAFLKLF